MKKVYFTFIALFCFSIAFTQTPMYTSTQTFLSPWNIEWTVTPGQTYLLRISGVFGDGVWEGQTAFIDAGYDFRTLPAIAYNTCGPAPQSRWRYVDDCTIRPDLDIYTTSHIYDYTIVNTDGTVSLDFSDQALGDNSGSLTFELFCISSITASITPQSTTTFCQGGFVVLNANTGANYNYEWFLDDVVINEATSASYTAMVSGEYTVEINDGNCPALSIPVTVTVNQNPTVTLSPFSALCSNAQAVTLTGGSPSGGSYTLDGNSATSIQPWLLSAGSHPVVYSYTDGNGCIGTATQSVTINTAPTVTLSGLGTNYLVTDGPVQLTGTPSGGIFTGAGVQGNMFDPSLAGLGTHSVIYMYSNGCMNADGLCTTVDLQIGIGDGNDMNGNGGNLSVMPNPTSGSFTINLNAVNPLGLTTLEIYNALGQLIQSEQINNQSNTLKKQIELNVAKGIYTVRLTTNGNVYSEKLIIR